MTDQRGENENRNVFLLFSDCPDPNAGRAHVIYCWRCCLDGIFWIVKASRTNDWRWNPRYYHPLPGTAAGSTAGFDATPLPKIDPNCDLPGSGCQISRLRRQPGKNSSNQGCFVLARKDHSHHRSLLGSMSTTTNCCQNVL